MQVTNKQIRSLDTLEVDFEVKNGDVCVERVEAWLEYAWRFIDVTDYFRADIRAMTRLERDIQAWYDEQKHLPCDNDAMDRAKDYSLEGGVA